MSVTRIVGGATVERGRYPYMAGLVMESGERPNCGGVLIAPNVVLSAGHCDGAVEVLVGCFNIHERGQGDCEVFSVEEDHLIDSYSKTLRLVIDDFRVLVLNESSKNDPISFLPTEDFVLDDSVDFTVTGWGSVAYISAFPGSLREVELDVVNNTYCNQKYRESFSNDVITDSMFCGIRDGKDSCQSDSGGPAILKCDALDEDLLVGLVSWGSGCATSFPGVYARVSYALDFISEIVEDQGHTLNLISNSEFCVAGGTKSPTASPIPPTPSPIPPRNWICNDFEYGGVDGCHCECGAFDPDCIDPDSPDLLYGCNDGETCNLDGECIPLTDTPTVDPTESPIPHPTLNPTTKPSLFPTRSPQTFVPTVTESSDDSSVGAVLGSVAGIFLLVLIAVIGFMAYRSKNDKRKMKSDENDEDLSKIEIQAAPMKNEKSKSKEEMVVHEV